MNTDKIINELNKFNFVLFNDFKNTKYENICLDFKRIIDGIEFIYRVKSLKNNGINKILFYGDTYLDHDDWENCKYRMEFNNEEDLLKNWNKIWLY